MKLLYAIENMNISYINFTIMDYLVVLPQP